MNKGNIFIDTSGFYAALVTGDSAHNKARKLLGELARSKRTAITTDYIVDETSTLLKARGVSGAIVPFFDMLKTSKALTLRFIDEDVFDDATAMFLKRSDQSYSFTDCTSFLVMKQLKLDKALTTDLHFQNEGFHVLLR